MYMCVMYMGYRSGDCRRGARSGAHGAVLMTLCGCPGFGLRPRGPEARGELGLCSLPCLL